MWGSEQSKKVRPPGGYRAEMRLAFAQKRMRLSSRRRARVPAAARVRARERACQRARRVRRVRRERVRGGRGGRL